MNYPKSPFEELGEALHDLKAALLKLVVKTFKINEILDWLARILK